MSAKGVLKPVGSGEYAGGPSRIPSGKGNSNPGRSLVMRCARGG